MRHLTDIEQQHFVPLLDVPEECIGFWLFRIIRQRFAISGNKNPAKKTHENAIRKVAEIETSSGYFSEIFSITELYTHLMQLRMHTLRLEYLIGMKSRQSEFPNHIQYSYVAN